jgi:hypothetical protein
MGSVVDFVTRKPGRKYDVPQNIALPWPFSSRRVGEVPRAGPYAAFLGGGYNPVWTEFRGKATRTITKTLQQMKEEVPEPYVGIAPDGRFELAVGSDLGADVTIDRLDRRRSLADQLDAGMRLRDDAAFQSSDRFREMAYNLIASPKVRDALDVSREPSALRESYGMTVFGQASLAARRLVEAGSKFVTVFWDEYGLAGSGWDTHWEHYPRMKDELLPGFDKALFGLLTDLDSRGMLDETLVLVLSEHGRTPKINKASGGGRDHWSRVYSGLMAGGGVARGRVVGRSDKHADSVAERPISPKDVLTTAYHLLGIDTEMTLTDRTGRPMPLVSSGEVIGDALG